MKASEKIINCGETENEKKMMMEKNRKGKSDDVHKVKKSMANMKLKMQKKI